MQIIQVVLTILLALFINILEAQQDLNRYLEQAAENNPGLQATFHEYMAALEQAPQAKALPDPQIAFAYFISPVETRVGPQQFKVSATQFFPWFGTLTAKKNIAVQEAKAKYERFQQEKSRLFNEIKAVYFNLYLNQRSITITMESMELLRSIKRMASKKFEAGKVSILDEYRVKMEINELENQLALLQDKHLLLEKEFGNLLNAPGKKDIHLPDTLWRTDLPLSKQQALDSVRTKNHKLLQLEFEQAALAYRKKASEYAGKPTFNINLEYISIGKGEQNLAGKDAFVFPSFGMTIPLYRNKYKAMVQEVSYLEAASEYKTASEHNTLNTLFHEAWKDYRDAKRRIALNEKQMELAHKSLKLLESEYATTSTEFEDLLRMERKILQYSLKYEKAKADKQAAIAFINYLMGR
ncbi:MAG: TolC family protein [Bacteroidales bacterium]